MPAGSSPRACHSIPCSCSFLRSVLRLIPSTSAARVWLPWAWFITTSSIGFSTQASTIAYTSIVFSPSRSLKYCFMTLRTVEESSFSRPDESARASERLFWWVLGCKGDLVVIFQARRGFQLLAEELRDGGQLLGGRFQG